MATKSNRRRSPRQILTVALGRFIYESLGRPLRFTRIDITPDVINGKFVSQGDSFIFSAVFAGKDNDRIELIYKPVKLSRSRKDGDDERFDKVSTRGKNSRKRKKKPKCVNSAPCGDTCIELGDVCHVGRGNPLNTPANAKRLKSLAEEASQKQDVYSDMTIRQLKEEARLAGVYRYGELNQGELRKTLRAVNQDPSMQTRIRKTLNKKQRRRRAITKALPADPAKAYKEFRRITKLAGVNPELATLTAAALVIGISRNQYSLARDRYKNGLQNSARVAMDRARNVETVKTKKKAMMFAVGGFTNAGGSTDSLIKGLNPLSKQDDETWFTKSQEIIAVNHPSMDGFKPIGKKNGVLYSGQIMFGGLKRSVGQLIRGQNDAAIDLASKLYANGARNPKKQINVLTHGAGAVNVRAAGEILRRMNSRGQGGPRGADIFARLNVVNLGGPYFGFTNDKAWDMVPYRTISSIKDLTSVLPKKFPEWIDSVKGGTASDYLKNPEVRERLRESFGFYSSSLGALGKRQARNKAIIADLKDAASLVHPAAGKALDTTLLIAEKFRDRPATAAALSTLAIGGTTAAGYGLAKKRYEQNIKDGAKQARDYAIQNPPTTTAVRKQVVIGVGGGDTTGKELRDEVAKNPALSKQEQQDLKRSHFIEVNPSDGVASTPEGVVPGTYAWAAHNVKMFYGNTLGKIDNIGRNPEAVQLAGQIYANATKDYVREDKVTGRKEQIRHPINVLAYGEGGLVAREALDILSKIPPSDGLPSGKSLIDGQAPQVRVVTMGTPSFGISKGDNPETNVMANTDVWAKTPLTLGRGKTTTVSGVPEPDGKGYASSEEVGKAIRPSLQLRVNNVERRSTKVVDPGVGEGRERTTKTKVIETYPSFIAKPENLDGWKTMSTKERGRVVRRYNEQLERIGRRYREEFDILKAQYAGRKPPEPIYKLAAKLAIDKQRKIWEKDGDDELINWPQNGRGVRTDSAAFWAGYYGLRLDKGPKPPGQPGQPGKRDVSKLQKKEITNKSGEKQTVYINPNKDEGKGNDIGKAMGQGTELAKKAVGEHIADPEAAKNTAQMVQEYARKNFSQGSRNPELDKEIMQSAATAMTTGDLPSRQQLTSMMARSVQGFLADPIGEVKRGFEREAIAREAFKARFGEDAPSKAQVAKQALKAGGEKVKDLVIDPETVVLAGGVAGGMIGGSVAGPAGALVGDLAGGLAARKVTEFAGKVKKQMDSINEAAPEFESDMGKLEKISKSVGGALSEMKKPETQMEMEDNLVGDASGWAIGNAVGKTANAIAPMSQNLLSGQGLAAVSASGGTAALAVPLIVKPLVKKAHDNARNGMSPAEATTAAVADYMTEGDRREQEVRDKFKSKVRSLQGQVVRSQAVNMAKNKAVEVVKETASNMNEDRKKKRERELANA